MILPHAHMASALPQVLLYTQPFAFTLVALVTFVGMTLATALFSKVSFNGKGAASLPGVVRMLVAAFAAAAWSTVVALLGLAFKGKSGSGSTVDTVAYAGWGAIFFLWAVISWCNRYKKGGLEAKALEERKQTAKGAATQLLALEQELFDRRLLLDCEFLESSKNDNSKTKKAKMLAEQGAFWSRKERKKWRKQLQKTADGKREVPMSTVARWMRELENITDAAAFLELDPNETAGKIVDTVVEEDLSRQDSKLSSGSELILRQASSGSELGAYAIQPSPSNATTNALTEYSSEAKLGTDAIEPVPPGLIGQADIEVGKSNSRKRLYNSGVEFLLYRRAWLQALSKAPEDEAGYAMDFDPATINACWDALVKAFPAASSDRKPGTTAPASAEFLMPHSFLAALKETLEPTPQRQSRWEKSGGKRKPSPLELDWLSNNSSAQPGEDAWDPTGAAEEKEPMPEVETGPSDPNLSKQFRELLTEPKMVGQAVIEMMNKWPLGVSWMECSSNPAAVAHGVAGGGSFNTIPDAYVKNKDMLAKALELQPHFNEALETHKHEAHKWL